jgi:hypothetical protein
MWTLCSLTSFQNNGDMKYLERYVPEDQLNDAKARKEHAKEMQNITDPAEWWRNKIEADIKFVYHWTSITHI